MQKITAISFTKTPSTPATCPDRVIERKMPKI